MRDREDGGKKVLSKTAMTCRSNKLNSVGRHSRNLFGKSFKHQNQQSSYHRSNQQKQSQHKVVKNKDEVDFRDIMSDNIVQVTEEKQSQNRLLRIRIERILTLKILDGMQKNLFRLLKSLSMIDN